MTGKTAQGEALIEITACNIKATRKFPHSFDTPGGKAGRDIITPLLTPPAA
jgi:hypothetical protein